MSNYICKAPFFTAEIFGDGRVFCCCPAYTKIKEIGNIYCQTWDEVWNSDIAREFREKIKKGDYSSCYTNFCDPQFFPLCQELKYVDPEKLDINNPKARIVKLSMDASCNVACTICRSKIRCNQDESRTRFLDSKTDIILETLKDAEIVNFTGSGDPFASKHVRRLIKIINEKYPNIKFNFHTNGTLCDERNLKELGVIDKLSTIEISLHSATKSTYDKIVKYGNWERVNKNLDFLSGLIKQGKLDELQLNFVVFSENFRAIPDFIELCKKYNAKAFLWQYRPMGGIYDFDSVDVTSPLHKNHKEFIQIMTNIDSNNPNLFMSPLFKKYTQIKDVEQYNLFASIIANQIAERYESKHCAFDKRFQALENSVQILLDKVGTSKVDKILLFFKKIFSLKNKYKKIINKEKLLRFWHRN